MWCFMALYGTVTDESHGLATFSPVFPPLFFPFFACFLFPSVSLPFVPARRPPVLPCRLCGALLSWLVLAIDGYTDSFWDQWHWLRSMGLCLLTLTAHREHLMKPSLTAWTRFTLMILQSRARGGVGPLRTR